jgi:integrase
MTPGQSYKVGEKGTNRVRLFRHRDRWTLEWYDGPHRRRAPLPETMGVGEAKQKAEEKAASLRAPRPGERLRLDALSQLFLRTVTPATRSRTTHHHHHATARRLLQHFGPDFDVATLSNEKANRFRDQRRQLGDERRQGATRVVRKRTAAGDLSILRTMVRWAVAERLLAANPLAGLALDFGTPKDTPVLAVEEYRRLLAAADQPSVWLLLLLSWETGHRNGAIRQLQWLDIDFAEREVTWREEADKEEREHKTPLSKVALAALREAKLRAVGPWVVPHPHDPRKPMGKHFARDAWRRLERRAGVPHKPGLGWHSIRRAFATRFAHLSTKELAELGGWLDPSMVLRYQKPGKDRLRAALDAEPTGTDTEPSQVGEATAA